MHRITDYLIGLFVGWTWLDFSGGIPAESGRWCFTVGGAQKDWELTGPWRREESGTRVRGCMIVRRDKVQLLLDTWDRMDQDTDTRIRRAVIKDVVF